MNNMAVNYEMIPICDIHIADRIRQDEGDIEDLAEDIQKNGMINPITVMERDEDGYLLIAGVRRLKAMKQLGESSIPATVMSPMEAIDALALEISENEKRKNFTPSERLAYAELLKESESQKAKERMLAGKAVATLMYERTSGQEKGPVRDIVARKVGFSSPIQMVRAKEVSEKRPDLMEKVDAGDLTIYGAYTQMKKDEHAEANTDSDVQPTKNPETKTPDMKTRTPSLAKGESRAEEPNAWITRFTAPCESADEEHSTKVVSTHGATKEAQSGNDQVGVSQEEEKDILKCMKFLADKGFIPERKVHIPSYEVYRPDREHAPGNARSLKGADHDHLLENPIYSKLYDAYIKAVQDNNRLCDCLRRCCQSYERTIRGDNENIQACQREILMQRAQLSECRAQLSECRAQLSECRAQLSECRAQLQSCDHEAQAQNEDSEVAHEERAAPDGNDSGEKGDDTEPVDVLDTMESLVDCGIIEEKRVEVPFYEEVYRPEREPAPGNPRALKGADHRHLLENPIYSRLYQEYEKAVMEINKSRGDTQLCSEGYERQIRGYKENLQACQREILRLRGLVKDYRSKCQ